MTTITTLRELEALAKRVHTAEEAYLAKYFKRLFLGLHSHTGSSEKHNALNDEHGLPEVIAVMPAMASFLARDQQVFDVKKDALSFPAKELVLLPITVLLGVFKPERALAVVKNAANLTWKLGDYFREYDRICSERDQIAGHIMSAYYLTQDSAGTYILRRAEWRREYSGQGPVKDSQDRIGIDPSIDLTKLPRLPSPNSEGNQDGSATEVLTKS
jgi:hypothetical protein